MELMFDAEFPSDKPAWLLSESGRNLELDGYSEPLGIAFEYQGFQHYRTEKVWLADQVENIIKRDRKKYAICWERGVNLVVIPQFNKLVHLESILREIETCVTRAGLKEPKGWRSKRPTTIPPQLLARVLDR